MSPGRSRTSAVLWIIAAVVVVAVAIGAVLVLGGTVSQRPTPSPDSPGVQQSLAVAAFLKAYVRDDASTMEKLVTPASVPWTAPPPALPPGVSTDTVASFIEPYRESGQVVIGNPLVLEVRMTGDGKEPTGTVTARIEVRKQPTRTVAVGVVLDNGRWLVDTIDGVAAVKAVKSLTP